MPQDEDRLLAVAAARTAAATAETYFRTDGLHVAVKGAPGDVVSAADTAAESAVDALLARMRPEDGLLGEEGARREGARRWVVDAVDGTLNFVRGDPFWCSAVVLEDDEGPLVSAVHHVASGETFSAARGAGFWLGDDRVRRDSGNGLEQAALATYLHPGDEQTDTVRRVLRAIASPRIRGSGSLELAWCAVGRVDAWLQRDVHPWDWLPGALMVQEAGGVAETLRAPDGAWSFACGTSAAAQLRRLLTG